MFRKVSLLSALVVSLFAMTGCFFAATDGSYSVSGSYSTAVASVAYYGPHPVYDIHGDADWCSISGAHTHSYTPNDDTFFVVDNGRYVFVGDPSYYVSNINFNTYYYMGVHPLPVGNGWCYINGPHRHHWAASGYYNYTRVGSYNYYTYYGSRNSYYNPNHAHYDLQSYYVSNPPVRYQTSYRTTVGYSRPLPGYNSYNYNNSYNNNYGYTNNRYNNNYNNNYNYNNSYNNGYNNNYNYNHNYNNGYNNGYNSNTRPSSTTSTTRPSSTTVVRPSATTPSTGSYVRPSATTPSTGSYVRPSTGSSSSTGSYVRPSTGSSSSTGSYVRPSTGSSSSTGSYVRPSTGSSNRVYPNGKGQYMQSGSSDEDDSRSSGSSSGRSNSERPRRAMPVRAR